MGGGCSRPVQKIYVTVIEDPSARFSILDPSGNPIEQVAVVRLPDGRLTDMHMSDLDGDDVKTTMPRKGQVVPAILYDDGDVVYGHYGVYVTRRGTTRVGNMSCQAQRITKRICMVLSSILFIGIVMWIKSVRWGAVITGLAIVGCFSMTMPAINNRIAYYTDEE